MSLTSRTVARRRKLAPPKPPAPPDHARCEAVRWSRERCSGNGRWLRDDGRRCCDAHFAAPFVEYHDGGSDQCRKVKT